MGWKTTRNQSLAGHWVGDGRGCDVNDWKYQLRWFNPKKPNKDPISDVQLHTHPHLDDEPVKAQTCSDKNFSQSFIQWSTFQELIITYECEFLETDINERADIWLLHHPMRLLPSFLFIKLEKLPVTTHTCVIIEKSPSSTSFIFKKSFISVKKRNPSIHYGGLSTWFRSFCKWGWLGDTEKNDQIALQVLLLHPLVHLLPLLPPLAMLVIVLFTRLLRLVLQNAPISAKIAAEGGLLICFDRL